MKKMAKLFGLALCGAALLSGSAYASQNAVQLHLFKNELKAENRINTLEPALIHFQVDSIKEDAVYVGAVYENDQLTSVKVTKEKNFSIDFSGSESLDNTSFQLLALKGDGSLEPLTEPIEKTGTPQVIRYQNPIRVNPTNGNETLLAFRDPSIILVGDTYYMTGTKAPYFEEHGLCTGISLYSSKDLVNWKYENELLVRPDAAEGKWYQNYFWAPELFQSNGKFYLTINASRRGPGGQVQEVGLMVADDVRGPYTMVTEHNSMFVNNDAHLFTDDDGKQYMFTGGLLGMEVDLDHGLVIGDVFSVVGANPDRTKFDCYGMEGPYVLKRDGIYYCFYSTWGRGYEVGYATAENIRGPWTRCTSPLYGGINQAAVDLTNSRGYNLTYEPDLYPAGFREVGHNFVFQAPDGSDYIVAHVYEASGSPVTMAIDKITIENGKITVTNSDGGTGPTGVPQSIEEQPYAPIPEKAIDVYAVAIAGSDYAPPKQVNLLMTNGRKEQRAVTWAAAPDLSAVGSQTIAGTVTYADKTYNCTLHLTVAEASVEELYVTLPLGSDYTMPSYVSVNLSNGYSKLCSVVWNGQADTSKEGEQQISGMITELNLPVTLSLDITSGYTVRETFDSNVNSSISRTGLFNPDKVSWTGGKMTSSGGMQTVGFWDNHYTNFAFSGEATVTGGEYLRAVVFSEFPGGHVDLDAGLWFGFSPTGTGVELRIGGKSGESSSKAIVLEGLTYDPNNLRFTIEEQNNVVTLSNQGEVLARVTISADRKTFTAADAQGNALGTLTADRALATSGYAGLLFRDTPGTADNLTLKVRPNHENTLTENFDGEVDSEVVRLAPFQKGYTISGGKMNIDAPHDWVSAGFTQAVSGNHQWEAHLKMQTGEKISFGTYVEYPAGHPDLDKGVWFRLDGSNNITVAAENGAKTATVSTSYDLGAMLRNGVQAQIVTFGQDIRFYLYQDGVRLNLATVKMSDDNKTLTVYGFNQEPSQAQTVTLTTPIQTEDVYGSVVFHNVEGACDFIQLQYN